MKSEVANLTSYNRLRKCLGFTGAAALYARALPTKNSCKFLQSGRFSHCPESIQSSSTLFAISFLQGQTTFHRLLASHSAFEFQIKILAFFHFLRQNNKLKTSRYAKCEALLSPLLLLGRKKQRQKALSRKSNVETLMLLYYRARSLSKRFLKHLPHNIT